MSEPNTETIEMIIQGANCALCLNVTLDQLRAQPGVVGVHLSAANQCLRIEHEISVPGDYVDLVRVTLRGVTKYGNEIVMVEVDPEVAQLNCTHH